MYLLLYCVTYEDNTLTGCGHLYKLGLLRMFTFVALTAFLFIIATSASSPSKPDEESCPPSRRWWVDVGVVKAGVFREGYPQLPGYMKQVFYPNFTTEKRVRVIESNQIFNHHFFQTNDNKNIISWGVTMSWKVGWKRPLQSYNQQDLICTLKKDYKEHFFLHPPQ